MAVRLAARRSFVARSTTQAIERGELTVEDPREKRLREEKERARAERKAGRAKGGS